ncbi:MAG: hypothetical protein M0018_00545 [Nitrospiraceae bacterium]|nr:hypothetical protein [Nitrospiraceae bacterium]
MIWKLLRVAEMGFRKLDAFELLQDVYAGKMFTDGVAVQGKKDSRKDRRLMAFYTPVDKTPWFSARPKQS